MSKSESCLKDSNTSTSSFCRWQPISPVLTIPGNHWGTNEPHGAVIPPDAGIVKEKMTDSHCWRERSALSTSGYNQVIPLMVLHCFMSLWKPLQQHSQLQWGQRSRFLSLFPGSHSTKRDPEGIFSCGTN